jgi:hypothetical protein
MAVVEAVSPAEKQVWDAFPAGRLVDLRAGIEAEDDPVHADRWGEARQVRAEVLLALLCGAVDVPVGQLGLVFLRGARITGNIYLPGGEFKHALLLDRCCIADGINLNDATIRTLGLEGCCAEPISLQRAKVNGQLSLRGANLFGRGGPAMDADGLTVAGSVMCDIGFRAEGTVMMNGASIGGTLSFTGAHLDGKGGHALECDWITVPGGILCDQGSAGPEARFRAHGGIHICSANIGQFKLSGAWLEAPRKGAQAGPALDADQLSVTGAMYCGDGFYAKGLVSLRGASVHQIDFRGARLECVAKPDYGTTATTPSTGPATSTSSGSTRRAEAVLDAQDLTVTYEMLWAGYSKENGAWVKPFSADGVVILAGANIGRLRDDQDSWPEQIVLDGLTYRNLGNADIPVKDRLCWLRKAAYSPQPYQQLAAFYRGQGSDDSARRVLLEDQRLRRRQLSREWRLWGWVQDVLAGYGYLPRRALQWLVGAFAVGLLVFSIRPPAPADPATHPVFNPWIYTSDVLIPTQVFGQLGTWDPHGLTLVATLVLRLFGWILAITVAAAIGRSFIRS